MNSEMQQQHQGNPQAGVGNLNALALQQPQAAPAFESSKVDQYQTETEVDAPELQNAVVNDLQESCGAQQLQLEHQQQIVGLRVELELSMLPQCCRWLLV